MVNRLEMLRTEAGYKTAADFARKHDIAESTYRSAENGTRKLTMAVAKRYAVLFSADLGRPIHWLYLMEEIPSEVPGQGVQQIAEHLHQMAERIAKLESETGIKTPRGRPKHAKN